ncbi:MAG TPA: glycosyltransferase family 4 protein [Acidimicrobiales bacterium]|nr:glycosyltransferase family 4 protein [Acidimicrobiales bacterium]
MPRGAIDRPELGSTIQRGEVELGGWALRGKERATSVRVVINDEVFAEAELGIERPDVPVGLQEEDVASDCGWRAFVDLRPLPPGDAGVKLLARFADDGLEDWACLAHNVYPLRGHGILGNVDTPKDDACISGELLVVIGWAQTPRTINSVEVECDGAVLGLARLGVSRLDVESEEAGIGPLCGFEFRGIVDVERPGARTVSVTATDLDGSSAVLGTVSVTFRAHEPTVEEREYGERLSGLNHDSITLAPRHRRHEPRSVLVFTHSVSLGGGQLYLQDLLRELHPSLNRCVLMTPVGGVLGPELESMGIDVVISGRGWDHDIASYEGHIRQLQHLIVGSGCGVVLLNTLGQFAAADAAQRVGIPTIWALHESMEVADWIDRNSVGTPVSAYVRGRIEAALLGSSRLVFEAGATRRLYQRFTAAPERAVTLNYAVDVAAIDEHCTKATRTGLRTAYELPEDAVVLLCVGVFEDRKSQGFIMEAFRHVADAHPTAMLVLVGDHPCPLSEALHRAVPAHLANRIRFVPITPDIWDWYRAADVLVSASDVESLPRSMLEAMLFECPVLSVAVFGIPELIRDGENGWLVEERDMASLVAGLHRVLRMDRAAWAAAGAKGRAIVADQYRTDHFRDAYLRMIDELALH